ncbi:sulfotransferase domain-containing protein [Wenzhouxiangella sediminis]|uniref:Sulfotransferase n=1 Tax=Wenzhouxiangella sediminis TaxID=1792836 RepID=A0A3E1K7B5_9GAMM|nr:sulfotransferase domain-containing protein [Wenzhouxiangella sediminis]RFF29574.1 sulfotransferase [Wenzhouxiangella sediminis]
MTGDPDEMTEPVDRQLPNFFLVGAPKCGTTSLASWLNEHSAVFMCKPKEPFFFSRDIQSPRAAESWSDYRRLFKGAQPGHLAIGEASTTYLRSQVAVPAILERVPSARFVVCVRNPVEMVSSVHGQLIRSGREDVYDLRKAWNLQGARRAGQALPPLTTEVGDLLYGEVCALGTQLKRLLKYVDRAQVLVLFLDDLRQKPDRVWSTLTSFLGIPHDGRQTFSKKNERRIPRSMRLTRFVALAHRTKNWLMPRRTLGIGPWLREALVRAPSESEFCIPDDLRRELRLFFEPEITMLEDLTDKNLSSWRRNDK